MRVDEDEFYTDKLEGFTSGSIGELLNRIPNVGKTANALQYLDEKDRFTALRFFLTQFVSQSPIVASGLTNMLAAIIDAQTIAFMKKENFHIHALYDATDVIASKKISEKVKPCLLNIVKAIFPDGKKGGGSPNMNNVYDSLAEYFINENDKNHESFKRWLGIAEAEGFAFTVLAEYKKEKQNA
jgi:hypothetical protein